jgi:hypothetical protein
MPRFVNRGFTATLLIVLIAAELLLRAGASASPSVVRVVYGTTLAMYMEIDKRLRAAAPDVRVLAMGDSLAMTQFQPDIFAADHGLPVSAVFNASYLAQTYRSQENLIRHIGLDHFPQLRRVLLFVNPRRLTAEGNIDAAVFRIAIPDRDGAWRESWHDRSVSPLFDRSRLYGLSRYLISASWRQVGRPSGWDQVEYLSPQGGVVFEGRRMTDASPPYLYEPLKAVSEEYVSDLKRVVELFRSRNIGVVLLPSVHHPNAKVFADAGVERQFESWMASLAKDTGAVWIALPAAGFTPAADTDFLDYGHVNRSGGIAFTHRLRDLIPDS